jgi:S-DNA-T family DNA segregation ATPase FtsK/SpoIIIE
MAEESGRKRRPDRAEDEPRPRRRNRSIPVSEPERLNPETRQGVAVVTLFAFAGLTSLALLGVAGAFGAAIAGALGTLVGWARFAVPFVLLAYAVALLQPDRFPIRASNLLGLGLTTVSVTGLLHLLIPAADTFAAALEGRGGGYVGVFLSYPFRAVMGAWATLVVLAAFFIIGILVTFNTSLSNLAEGGSAVGRAAGGLKALRDRFRRPPPTVLPPESVQPDAEADWDGREREVKIAEPAQAAPKPVQTRLPRVRRTIAIPLDLLDAATTKPNAGDIEARKAIIQKTLANFGIAVEMGDVNVGPTVTQFTLKPAEGVKLVSITALGNDLALALAAHPIRIEAPIPGKSLVGVEVPNASVATVNLRGILESDAFKKRPGNLTAALGRDVSGSPYVVNLDPLPHLLIAGATGSGKSVCINAILLSLLYSNSPDDLQLILVDPKRVELTVYNDVPHLKAPVITDVSQTINALQWVVREMDRRFALLSESGKRNIQAYNATAEEPIPFLLVVVDELADLMAVAAQAVEGAIIRLAQMARAVGIHLIVATQRPSVDVITGLIKANITARAAFNVASAVDSRTILDTSGAEKLLGRGDMLYISAELSKPKRLQGAYVSDPEIERVVGFLKEHGRPSYDPAVTERHAAEAVDGLTGEVGGDDPLLGEAKDLVIRAGKASASLLQRRLRVGYARAARLLDLLEERGIIGPGEGAKPREILVARPEGIPEDPSFGSEEEGDTETGPDSEPRDGV